MGTSETVSNLELIIVGMIGMFLLALGVVFFFLVYQRRLLRQQKEHQEKEAEYQQKLLRASLLSQEKERSRIGKDLHDGVGAMLSTTKLYLRNIDAKTGEEDFDKLKKKALELLDETMSGIRRVSHDLRPVVLERLGLVEAINNLVEHVNQSGELQITFDHRLKGRFNEEYQLSWYRIIQELVNNTLKHAQASSVLLKLKSNDKEVSLKYCDDGVGMDTSKALKAGLGIQNIESRLNLMGGSVKVISPESGGLCLHLQSRLKPQA